LSTIEVKINKSKYHVYALKKSDLGYLYISAASQTWAWQKSKLPLGFNLVTFLQI